MTLSVACVIAWALSLTFAGIALYKDKQNYASIHLVCAAVSIVFMYLV